MVSKLANLFPEILFLDQNVAMFQIFVRGFREDCDGELVVGGRSNLPSFGNETQYQIIRGIS